LVVAGVSLFCGANDAVASRFIWGVPGTTTAPLKFPYAIALDTHRQLSLVIADRWGNQVFRISHNGKVDVVAGDGVAGFNGDQHASAKNLRINEPQGGAVNSRGETIIADTKNNRLVKVDLQGRSTAILGGSSASSSDVDASNVCTRLRKPSAIAIDSQ